MSELRLEVNERRYRGWTTVQVTRAMDTLTGSFQLTATDRWTDAGKPMAIQRGDACRVLIDDEVVIDGYIDARAITIDAANRSQSYRGRDRALDVFDSSALPESWTVRGVSLLEFANRLCNVHSVMVTAGDGVTFPAPPPKFTINPGDTVFQALSREAQAAGVLLLSDGKGGLVFERSRIVRATPLVLGQNIKSIDGEDDDSQRFHRYVVLGQGAGSDQKSGSASNVRGEAFDEGIARTNRVHVMRPMSARESRIAQQTADWTARNRAGQATGRTVMVVGWRQRPDLAGSPLWAPNLTSFLDALAADIQRDMLIASVTYALDREGGEVATMRLVRPDTFTPSPTARVSA